MKCPFCISDIDTKAVVCKFCNRDIYLFKQLMLRIIELEKQLKSSQAIITPDTALSCLQSESGAAQNLTAPLRKFYYPVLDIALYIVLPLILLLLAHVFITLIYDIKILYLRTVTLVMPLLFGYFLFKNRPRHIAAWLIGVCVLSLSAVVGMSAMTGWVDDSSVWPQGIYEWREVIAFAASIVFSYLTGMLLGRLSLSKKSKTLSNQLSHPLLGSVLTGLGDEHVPPATLQVISKKINEVFTAIVAIATTIMAIYTGLKGLL